MTTSATAAQNTEPFRTSELHDEQGQWIAGPYRRPRNNSSHEAGTIHDDRTARELGFRGGTIAGSIHMEQFEPLCESQFGAEWHQHGGLSLYFLNPSIDDEPVQSLIATEDEARADALRRRRVLMRTAQGVQVLDGSASLGGLDERSAVRLRLAKAMRQPANVRVLASVPIGYSASSLPTEVPQRDIDQRLDIITERRAVYAPTKGGQRSVAPLSAAVHAMRVFEDELPIRDAEADKQFVGMFGAIDWQYLNGPVYSDTSYLVDGVVRAVGESPKTEMLWYECTLRNASTGVEVARILMLSRILKATAQAWGHKS